MARGSWPRGGVRTRLPVVWKRPTGGFDPRTIPGITLWLDAADTSALTIDTGVSAWRNKAGTGITSFVQGTGNSQPLSGTATVNGRNVLVFDGVDDFMTATDPFMTGATYGTLPFTMWVVQQIVAATNFGMTYTTGNGFEFRQNATTGQMQVNSDTGTTVHTFATSSTGVTEVVSLVFPSGATNNLFWRGGVAQVLSGTATAKPATSTATHTIGRRTAGANPASVRVCEIIAAQSQPSDTLRAQVDRYLGAKWGVTIA
jgi:hypothetical protein